MELLQASSGPIGAREHGNPGRTGSCAADVVILRGLSVSHLVFILSVTGALAWGCSAATPASTQAARDGVSPDPSLFEGSGTAAASVEAPDPVAYVALGDSYTIGTSVRAQDRWPNQLVRALEPDLQLRLVDNLAVNGYTTRDLIAEELPQLASLDADMVSVLIGVNDVVQDVGNMEYRANVATILDEVSHKVPRGRVVVVSTPDYTLTPKGTDHVDRERQSARIRRFNQIMAEEAGSRELPFVDISPVADRVREDDTLVARDGLHPSAKQYAGWVELIAPVVREMLEQRQR